LTSEAELLANAFSIQELDAMRARIIPAARGQSSKNGDGIEYRCNICS
jgi:hypothetical protein